MGDTLKEARNNIREAIALYPELAEEPPAPEGGMVEETVLWGNPFRGRRHCGSVVSVPPISP
jgi:hypothetical protein